MTIYQSARRFGIRHPRIKAVFDPILSLLRVRHAARNAIRRQIFDAMAGMLVEDPVVRIDEFSGEFQLSAHSDLFLRVIANRAYETELVATASKWLDSARDVIDVGANVGFYSVWFAKMINRDRRVLAVEPTTSALARLRRNLVRNEVQDRVVVVSGIAASSSGSSTVNVVPGKEEYSTVGPVCHPSVDGATAIQETVPAFTIDELVRRFDIAPGFMKIDVEGGEGSVLNGARETIKRYMPVILSELSDDLLRNQGTSALAIVKQLEAMGYRVLDPQDSAIAAGTRPYGDILCLPQ